MTLSELRAFAESVHADQTALDQEIGEEVPTAEQEARWEELKTKREEADRDLAEAEARAARVAESRARWASTQVSPMPQDPFEDDVRTMSARSVYDKAMTVADSPETGEHLQADQKARLQKVLRTRNQDLDGDLIGRLLLATENPAYRSAFQKIAAGTSPIFTSEEGRAVQEVQNIKRALSIGTDASGGFAVPVLIDPTIILTGQGTPNDILRLARVETITNDEWRGVSSAGVSWSFHAEATAATDNSPTIAQPNVVTRRADGFIPFSIEVGQDWPGFATAMSDLLAEGYSELLAEKLVNGTQGSNEPNGVVAKIDATTSPANREAATAGTIATADIYGLWGALPQRYRGNAAWLSSTNVQNAIRQLGTLDPNFSVNITAENVPALFGHQYALNDYVADKASGTGVQPQLLVGDFRGYLVAQRAGMTVEFIPHLFDVTNNRPTGQRGWFAWSRIGADVINTNAFRLLVNRSV